MQEAGAPVAGQADQILDAATAAFVDSLNHIVLIGAVIAFAAGLLSLLLIRQKDFVPHGGAPVAPVADVPVDEPPELHPAGKHAG